MSRCVGLLVRIKDILIIHKCALHITACAGMFGSCRPTFRKLQIFFVVYFNHYLLFIRTNEQQLSTRRFIHSYETLLRNMIHIPRNRLYKTDSCEVVRSSKMFNNCLLVHDLNDKLFIKKVLCILTQKLFYYINEYCIYCIRSLHVIL